MQSEEISSVEDYKHTRTHAHIHARTHTHTHTHTHTLTHTFGSKLTRQKVEMTSIHKNLSYM